LAQAFVLLVDIRTEGGPFCSPCNGPCLDCCRRP